VLLQEKNREMDVEIHFKDTFRAFSKDEDGKRTVKRNSYIKMKNTESFC
jgi:hypothetical protein